MENLGLDAKLFALYGKFDIEEIANHLLMNGYKTKVDKKCGVLTVPEEEYYERETQIGGHPGKPECCHQFGGELAPAVH